MGVVYLGQDPSGYQVAVKLLRAHVVSDDSGRARMAREVTSLRRVRSPLVAEVYDADPWGDIPYLVTRYVAGPSLHDRVEHAGPLTGPDLDVVAAGLAQALVAVHAADVLHRDVKPSNVLLEGTTPVLIDFGLAQLADDSRITHTGWLLGTPGYLAPEILFGDDPTPLADVHSWAATVVYAATGRGPYGNGPAVAVMDRVRRGEHDLSGVPDSLYWVVRQSLSADPRDRPSSWQLADWLAGPPGLTGLGVASGAQGAVMSAAATWIGPATSSPPRLDVRAAAPPVPGSGSGSGSGSVQAWPARPRAPVPAQAGGWPSARGQAATAGPASVPAQPAVSWPVAATNGATGWPIQRLRPAKAVASLFWLGMVGVALAAAVTAPGAAAGLVLAASWLLRTVSVSKNRLLQWRIRRGPRRNDAMLATLCTPWFIVLALPGAVLNAAFAVAGGGFAVIVATMALPPRLLVYVLALGAVVACTAAWWGPFSRDVRVGGRAVSSALLRTGVTTVLVLSVLVAACLTLLLVRQVAGPAYAPFPLPPWRHGLRELLPHG
jgi:hypothetical protein